MVKKKHASIYPTKIFLNNGIGVPVKFVAIKGIFFSEDGQIMTEKNTKSSVIISV
jgi:hypothetical protein